MRGRGRETFSKVSFPLFSSPNNFGSTTLSKDDAFLTIKQYPSTCAAKKFRGIEYEVDGRTGLEGGPVLGEGDECPDRLP